MTSQNGFIDDTSMLTDSVIEPNAKIYKQCRIKGSHISESATVGDFSIISRSRLNSFSSIHRNNYVVDVELGRHSYTGMNSVIMQSNIGSFTSISWNVSIGPGNHDYNRITTHSFIYSPDSILNPLNHVSYNRFQEVCEIGHDVWIGCNVTVLRGVKIGSGAVVGANSVVTKDIPPYSVVAGSPAKIIRYRFDHDIIASLLDFQWWNLSDSFIRENFKYFSNSEVTLKNIEELKKKYEENKNDSL